MEDRLSKENNTLIPHLSFLHLNYCIKYVYHVSFDCASRYELIFSVGKGDEINEYSCYKVSLWILLSFA
jgi:hypothetical protein